MYICRETAAIGYYCNTAAVGPGAICSGAGAISWSGDTEKFETIQLWRTGHRPNILDKSSNIHPVPNKTRSEAY